MNRCLCGLAVRHHRGLRNESLSCKEARKRHPRATVKKIPLVWLLARAKGRRVSF